MYQSDKFVSIREFNRQTKSFKQYATPPPPPAVATALVTLWLTVQRDLKSMQREVNRLIIANNSSIVQSLLREDYTQARCGAIESHSRLSENYDKAGRQWNYAYKLEWACARQSGETVRDPRGAGVSRPRDTISGSKHGVRVCPVGSSPTHWSRATQREIKRWQEAAAAAATSVITPRRACIHAWCTVGSRVVYMYIYMFRDAHARQECVYGRGAPTSKARARCCSDAEAGSYDN